MNVRARGSVMWEDTGISRNKFLCGRGKGLIVARRKPQMTLLSGDCVTYNYYYIKILIDMYYNVMYCYMLCDTHKHPGR